MAHTAVYVSVFTSEGKEIATAHLFNCIEPAVAELVIEKMGQDDYSWCYGARKLVEAFKVFYGTTHTVVFLKKEEL